MLPLALETSVTPHLTRIDLKENHRLLIVDDNEAIHDDFRKILGVDPAAEELDAAEAGIFGEIKATRKRGAFEMEFAFQGAEALRRVEDAMAAGRRYAVVFMDVRMPPGWDGLETTQQLWKVDPDLQIVICTAYSDYSWEEMMEVIGSPERLLILKKPFDTIEVLQLAHALTEKWSLLQAARGNIAVLEGIVSERTKDLQASKVLLEAEIVERKQSAEVLAESERRFREMMENVEMLAMTLDQQGTIVFCNEFFLKTTGWSREEAMGSNWFSRFIPGHPDRQELFAANLEAGIIPAHGENSIYTKEGAWREITWNNIVLRDGRGEIVGVASIGEDVTERRRSEERVHEQAALLDKAQDAILVRGLDDTIHFWNKSAEHLYGWTSKEVVGRKVTELLYNELNQFYEARTEVLEKGAWVGELRQRSKDQREVTVEAHWTLVRDERGLPKSILAINTDITERNLLKVQLIRAQRTESLGTLAGGIAHDLNNSLSPITMAIGLLKHKIHEPATLEILEICETSCRRSAEMVRQVLSFARGVSGERVALQPKYLLQEVQKIVNDTFPKNISLECTIAPELWNVIGDSTQIHQVMLNLCVNARDAMQDGGVLKLSAMNQTFDEAYVTMNGEARVGPYIVLEVQDSGTGIPAVILEKIFDPFFTTKPLGQGTGLGLSTSLGIVKSHGGFIRVVSEINKGTAIQVHLPAESGPVALPNAIPEPDAIHGHGEWVLVIDDEAALRSVTQRVLEQYGYRVLTAVDGVEGIALYSRRHQDIAVVLTDMMMPVMDGTATVAVLRKINPEVKIITSSGMNADRESAGHAVGGSPNFLAKPYTSGALLRLVSEVLEQVSAPPVTLARGFLCGETNVAEASRFGGLN